jgi:hypothetical protein
MLQHNGDGACDRRIRECLLCNSTRDRTIVLNGISDVDTTKHRLKADLPRLMRHTAITEMGCPRYVRFTDAFLVAPHQDRRHLSEGFGESPLVSRPRGRLNGARIHPLEFSTISEDLR